MLSDPRINATYISTTNECISSKHWRLRRSFHRVHAETDARLVGIPEEANATVAWRHDFPERGETRRTINNHRSCEAGFC